MKRIENSTLSELFLLNLEVVHIVFDEILFNFLLFHYFKNNF